MFIKSKVCVFEYHNGWAFAGWDDCGPSQIGFVSHDAAVAGAIKVYGQMPSWQISESRPAVIDFKPSLPAHDLRDDIVA